MNEKYARAMRIAYGVIFSVFTVVLGLLFILQATEIYSLGSGNVGAIYTRAEVARRLKIMAAYVAVWAVLAIVGYVVSVIVPAADKKRRSDAARALKNLKKRIPDCQSEAFLAENRRYKRYEGIRIAVWTFCALFAVASAAIGIVYLADSSHFPGTDVTAEVIAAVRAIMPWVGASFALFILAAVYEKFAARGELKCVGNMFAEGKGLPATQPRVPAVLGKVSAAVRSDVAIWVVRGCVAALAVAFIIAGVYNGGANSLLGKAIDLCKACIGLG